MSCLTSSLSAEDWLELSTPGDGIGRATLYIKLYHSVSSRGIFDITVGLLPEFDKKQEFVF